MKKRFFNITLCKIIKLLYFRTSFAFLRTRLYSKHIFIHFNTLIQGGQGMFSKSKILVLFLALGIFAAPETVSKQSAAFSFPPTGVILQKTYLMGGKAFSCKKSFSGRQVISLSWALPTKAENGKISIFTLSGALVKSFPVTAQKGMVNWDASHGTVASGIYLASLSYGPYKSNLKIMK
jgi:hypothetical protein